MELNRIEIEWNGILLKGHYVVLAKKSKLQIFSIYNLIR